MRCKVVICAACCTRVEGINHCHACLKILGRAKDPRASAGAAMGLVAVVVLGTIGLIFIGIGCLTQGMLSP